MSEPAWVTEGRRLVAGGMSVYAAEKKLGISSSALYKRLNPEKARVYNRRSNHAPGRQAAKNAWADEHYRGECVDCGTATARREYDRCWACQVLFWKSRQHPRRQQIERWWAEGLMLREIATRLDRSLGYVQQEFDRMRAAGYDLPYRYKPGKKNATKFPEQVAA